MRARRVAAASLAGLAVVSAGVLATEAPAMAAGPVSPGTVFIADQFNGRVVEVSPGGSQSTVFSGPNLTHWVAVDVAGDVFFSDMNPGFGRVMKVPAGGGPPTTVLTLTVLGEVNLAVDAAGDLFASDFNDNQVIKVPANGGPQTTVGTGLKGPTGVAVDAAGDVLIAEFFNNTIVKVPVGGGPQTTVFSTVGFQLDGIATDTAGDIFVCEINADRVVKLPAAGGPQTTVGSGLKNPTGVAVDAAGDVLIADSANNRMVKVPAGGGPQTTVGTGLNHPEGVAVSAPPPTFTADTPNTRATVGTPYAYAYAAATPSGEPQATFSLYNGTLPPGLTLDPRTGALSGTPSTAGTYQFTVQTQNAATATLAPLSTIVVAKASQTIRFTSTPPASPRPGGTYQLSATGGRSGNAVLFSADPTSTRGACTVSTVGTVHFSGAGRCVIDANQAGSPNDNPAAPAQQTVTVLLAVATSSSHTALASTGLASTGTTAGVLTLTAAAMVLLGILVLLMGRRPAARGRHARSGRPDYAATPPAGSM